MNTYNYMRLRSGKVYKTQNSHIEERDREVAEILVSMRKKPKSENKKMSYCSYIQNKIKKSILNSVNIKF